MGQLVRKENWGSLLVVEIERHSKLNFQWGVHDCCFSVCDCVRVMTGMDMARSFRWCFNLKDAFWILKEHGGVLGVAEYMAKALGIESIPVKYASTGDVMVVEHGKFELSLGIIVSGGLLYCVSDGQGWVGLDKLKGKKAWRI